MAGYVLHFPGRRGSNQLLQELGLAALLADCGPDWWDGPGPEGQHGSICGWGLGLDGGPLMSTAREWQPLPGNAECGRKHGDVWLGLEVARPLLPRDIARRETTPGYDLLLADKRIWHCPAAANLPHQHRLNPAGEYERTIAQRHQAMWERSQSYAGQFFRAIDALEAMKAKGIPDPPAVDFTCEESFAYCCQCLALNYRLTPEIVSLLGLIDDEAMRNVIKSSINLPVLITFGQKKKSCITIPVG